MRNVWCKKIGWEKYLWVVDFRRFLFLFSFDLGLFFVLGGGEQEMKEVALGFFFFLCMVILLACNLLFAACLLAC